MWKLIFGILSILVGIYGFFHPYVTALAIGWTVGFILIMQGINLVFEGIHMGKGMTKSTAP